MKQKSKTLIISPSFPSEIIREILLKLPVESLLRCKAVCKEWYSLISDQHFIKSHYRHHRLVFKTHEERNNLFSCPLYDVLFHNSLNNALLLENPLQRTQPHEVRVVGSCNGLMCLFVEDGLFIYNPSTRMCNGLPFRKKNSKPEWYSFGYDESTDDYKIVELVEISLQTRPYYITKGQIYSLNTGKWKDMGDFPYGYKYPLNGCGIFSNGALHWVACDKSLTQRIVSLDLAKETYGQVLQSEYDVGDMKLILGVLGGCLCGFSYYYYQSPDEQSYADLWVMKVYGVKDSWTKLASFSYDDGINDYMVPLFLSNDGKVLFDCASTMVIYNIKDSLSPQIEYISHIFDASIVVESLVSPFPPLGSRKGKSASMASSTRGELTSTVSLLTSSHSNEFNNMTSESYWLSRIRESEEAATHHISLGFFKLALEAGCQNIKQLRDELESYDCRHNLLGLGESAKQVFESYHILKQQEETLNSLES